MAFVIFKRLGLGSSAGGGAGGRTTCSPTATLTASPLFRVDHGVTTTFLSASASHFISKGLAMALRDLATFPFASMIL